MWVFWKERWHDGGFSFMWEIGPSKGKSCSSANKLIWIENLSNWRWIEDCENMWVDSNMLVGIFLVAICSDSVVEVGKCKLSRIMKKM